MQDRKHDIQLHFVGIGGIGMSGIAEVFLNQGYRVTGSDLSESDTTRRLVGLGAKIFSGHRAENVQGASVVVISSAIRSNNPEIMEAKHLRIPIIPRAEMLGELMRGKTGVAVAGTHGKTTTTSMLASVLVVAGLDPTLVIGGRVDSLGGTNAKLGQGKFVVAEADESDGSFLHLPATYGVVTNIDNDHLDHFGSMTEVENAFVDFVGKLPFYGVAAVCGDDPGVKRCLSRFSKPYVTYGLSDEWDYCAQSVRPQGLGSVFEIRGPEGARLGKVELHVPGTHNVLNALAATAIGVKLGIPFPTIVKGLQEFRGVKRRFEIRWKNDRRKQVVVDDYGHHPTEIAATLAAARSYWTGRIVTLFQPHRYTRTLHCRDGFLSAFRNSDLIFLTDVYAAGEDPIPGVDSASLAEDIARLKSPAQQVRYAGDLQNAQTELLKEIREGDLILCMGAGSITKVPDQLAEELEKRK